MNVKSIINTLFSDQPSTPARFRWWKKFVVFFIFMSLIFLMANIKVAMETDIPNQEAVSVIFWTYIGLCLAVALAPAFAPREVRMMASDISMIGSAIKKKKSPFRRLFWAWDYDAEATKVLDEREQFQRKNALAFSYKVHPCLMVGVLLGLIVGGKFQLSNVAILHFIAFTVATYVFTPAAYIVWKYKPLEAELE